MKTDTYTLATEGTLVETCKEARLLVLGDADTCVDDGELEMLAVIAQFHIHGDVTLVWCVFESIRQQVVGHLVYIVAVNE